MKKNLVFALLFIVGLVAGCTGKGGNGTSDTAQGTPATTSGNITAQIMPPQLATQPIRVTTQPSLQSNSVNITAVFVGLQTQSVNIFNGAALLCTLTPAKPNCMQCAPQNPMQFSVMPDTSIFKYVSVTNVPPTNPNNTGQLISTYADVTGNSVQITVQDQGIICSSSSGGHAK